MTTNNKQHSFSDNCFLNDLTETSNKVEPALTVENPDSISWDQECDVLVVGVGMAGAAATLRTAEDRSLKVIAIDRAMGGGASKMSGGVVYMGGGTPAQKECGIHDTPENMANYLAFETGDNLVRPDTRLRFAYASSTFQDWLATHGVRFGGPATDDKTSYPNDASLYFSGNEVTPDGRALAQAVQRGHRAKPPQCGEPTKLGGAYLLPPLLDSIDRQPNITFFRQTRATRMILDGNGEIVGLEVMRIPPGFAAWRHQFFYNFGSNLIANVLKLGPKFHSAAVKIEKAKAKPMRIRVHKGVVLSAGGFTYNREMMAKTAPEYLLSMPLGTIADDGSGIKLGMTASGKADHMHRVSAWKFLYPPESFTKSCSIDVNGKRLVSEEFYGARTGEAIFERSNSKGWLITDKPMFDTAQQEINSANKLFFQKIQFKAIMNDYTISAPTLTELAGKIGVPSNELVATIRQYNNDIEENKPDAFNKSEKIRFKIETGPFYATDIGASLPMAPIPALTMGGMVCDEDTGQVLGNDGQPVKGLFAAGRNAVGICSHYYVSGLSLADCIWSGWRAAETLKGNGGAKALAPHI